MSKPAARLVIQPASGSADDTDPGELLVHTFNDLRDELVSTLWFVLGNAEDAQDVAQEAFLRCWRTQERGDEIQNLRAWIFRVALNAAKDVQRSAWNRRVGLLHGTEPLLVGRGVTPVEQAAKQEMLHRLRQALLLLRLEEKEVFLLRQNGDLTYDQIADLHDRPVGTVKTQMRSALQKLRKALVGAP